MPEYLIDIGTIPTEIWGMAAFVWTIPDLLCYPARQALPDVGHRVPTVVLAHPDVFMNKKTSLDDNPRLNAVNTHLARLAEDVADCVGDLRGIRRLIDDYSMVDPSVLACPAAAIPVRAGGVAAEWLLSDDGDPSSRLMYVHGGSWMSGSLAGYRAHAARIAAATGCSVLNVDYRLTPEHPFPAGLDDCDQAFDWIMDHGPDRTQPAQSVFIAGDSAGGNLILALLLRRRDLGKPLPRAAIALSPATDLAWGSPSLDNRAERDPVLRPERLNAVVQAYVQDRAAVEDPYVSPLYGELSDLPPVLLQVGDAEVLLDDSVRFAEKLERAGGNAQLDVWPDMPHVFQMFAPFLAEATQALKVIGDFVARYRGR